MESLADYCLDGEQAFYIDWLKDLKAIIWSITVIIG
jgi:hypothetical protein